MSTVMTDAAAETTDLLQRLIRNSCVNEGVPESGHEIRSVDLLESYLRMPGVEMKRYEPVPGRASLVLRIEGSDPKAPSLHLMGHTDVVPVTPSGWREDPFAAELINGEVWGRGAIDMLGVTASMAVAVRRLQPVRSSKLCKWRKWRWRWRRPRRRQSRASSTTCSRSSRPRRAG